MEKEKVKHFMGENSQPFDDVCIIILENIYFALLR